MCFEHTFEWCLIDMVLRSMEGHETFFIIINECMTRFLLISDGFLRSHSLLLRMVLVLLPMEPQFVTCNLYHLEMDQKKLNRCLAEGLGGATIAP
jgi:hypothetical protein